MPDQSSAATTVLTCQQQVNLNPGYSASWDADVYFMSDPALPLVVRHYLSTGGTITNVCYPNQTFGNTTQSATTSWLTAFQRWRCCYAGLSTYLNASRMYDEGTVAACQYTAQPTNLTIIGNNAGTAFQTSAYKLVLWSSNDYPAYGNLMKLPNAYVGEARDGCYMPLRLDTNHAIWHDERDLSLSKLPGVTTIPVIAPAAAFPYLDCACAYVPDATGILSGDTHLCPCTNLMGVMSFKGLNPNAKLTFCMRLGYECMCTPDSPYAPFLHLAPEHDPLAVASYFAISRQLKDAYPVEYNDLGRLWDVIKSAAKVVNPFLGLLPGGSIVKSIGRAIGGAVGAMRPDEPLKGPVDPPPRAELERAEKQAKRAFEGKQRVTMGKMIAARKSIAKPKAKRS